MDQIRDKLLQIFKTERVVDLQSLQKKLKNKSTRSIFRYLLSKGYLSSFTHSGKYYTLKNIPRFNNDGIWFYKEIGFAKFGTLKNTLAKLIESSEGGKTHNELKDQLHIRVQNTLLDLVKANKVIRKKIERNFVYFSGNVDWLKKQVQNRERKLQEYKDTSCPDWIVIEILAAIIRIKSIIIDSKKIISELQSKNIIITIEQIEKTLNQLDLKKTLASK